MTSMPTNDPMQPQALSQTVHMAQMDAQPVMLVCMVPAAEMSSEITCTKRQARLLLLAAQADVHTAPSLSFSRKPHMCLKICRQRKSREGVQLWLKAGRNS